MPLTSWSLTAADNDDADAASGISWPEGMDPAQVNDSARAMMAELKRFYNQMANVVSATYATWTSAVTAFPKDGPTVASGSQILTATITPSSATSRILVRFSCPVSSNSGTGYVGGGLFYGSTILATDYATIPTADTFHKLHGQVLHSPATTSPVTYTVRVGPQSGLFAYINGPYNPSGALGGGVYGSSLILQEIP